VGLASIVSQGNITATIMWFAITTGATAGLKATKEKKDSFTVHENGDLQLSVFGLFAFSFLSNPEFNDAETFSFLCFLVVPFKFPGRVWV